jgi:hypothetical protein
VFDKINCLSYNIMSHEAHGGHGGGGGSGGIAEELTEKSVGKTLTATILLPFLWFLIYMDKNPVEE